MKINKLRKSAAFVIFCGLSSLCSAQSIDPSDENIQYTGRWNFDNPSAPKVTWHGSKLLFRFSGTSASVDIDAGTRSPYGVEWKEQYRVVIDGVPSDDLIYMDPGRATYTLANNLPLGEHTIELFKETTYSYKSASTIYGIDVDGTLLAPPARPNLRIEFFGDSNMDGTSNYSEQDSGDSGGYYAYPAMASRMLNAEMNLQAVGGATLDKSGQGGDNDVRSFIFSEDYINQDINYRSGFDPHVIVVNAGANDVGAGKEEIKNRYKDVITDLRSVYGNTPHIVLMNAYGWDLNEPANYSHEVVSEVGGNLSALKYPWMWEQFHGSMWDHSGQAHMLAQHIASLNPLWSIQSNNEIVNAFTNNGDVANGSFEYVAPFGGYGWRYYDDPGVERVYDPAGAADGNYYLRLSADNQSRGVHQATDATGDLIPGATQGGETYTLTAKLRGTSPGAKAKFETHFQGQELWTHKTEDGSPYPYQVTSIDVTTQWQEYTHTFSASAGVWQLYNYLYATQGSVEFDDIVLTVNNVSPPQNQQPTASFTVSSNNLTANFTSTSSDSDGNIESHYWDFGDGNNSDVENPSYSYASPGSYTVELTVTDNEGSSDSSSQVVAVSETTGNEVTMDIWSASLNRKGRLTVQLNWSNALGNNVEIVRNGSVIATTANDGTFKDVSSNMASGTYTYQVCELGGGSCSAEQSVNL
ncbi:PKD domain-containing protein [Thalassotalea crassostreae]|uniref:PKD domain-containing protein n=1 Tax=Thalassotalea crassostreae TaxID=1763536 RepID=UPI0008396229|nr:PKD domain-containing protein [Thalassotalea crassostreae]